jgi:hypothetical protein
MDREEAARALELLRKVTAKARDDTALENWGLIWVFSAFSNGAGFAGTQALFSRGESTPWPFAGLWALVLTVNGLIIAKLRRKNASSGSFIERQIWSLWTIFVVALILLAILNYILGLRPLFMAPVACLMAAMIFAAMAPIMGKVWYIPTALWATLAVAVALVPSYPFALIAVAWFFTQGTAGVLLDRRRRQRLQEGS